jgi:hypothetical protein
MYCRLADGQLIQNVRHPAVGSCRERNAGRPAFSAALVIFPSPSRLTNRFVSRPMATNVAKLEMGVSSRGS